MKFLLLIVACVVIYFAYKTSLVLGLLCSLGVMIYVIIKFIPFMFKNKSRKCFLEGEYKNAVAYYEKAMKYSSINFDSKMEYIRILLRAGEFEKAQQIIDSLLSHKLEPKKRNIAILERAMCYYKNGNLEEAYNDISELYDDGYRSMTLYGMLGYFKILKEPMSDDTFNFCCEAYDYADDNRDICDNMLICYYNRGEYEKAKEISDIIIESEPKFVEAWYHAAQIDVAIGDYKSAKEKLDRIHECNRSAMTTISEKDIEELISSVNAKLEEKE